MCPGFIHFSVIGRYDNLFLNCTGDTAVWNNVHAWSKQNNFLSLKFTPSLCWHAQTANVMTMDYALLRKDKMVLVVVVSSVDYRISIDYIRFRISYLQPLEVSPLILVMWENSVQTNCILAYRDSWHCFFLQYEKYRICYIIERVGG